MRKLLAIIALSMLTASAADLEITIKKSNENDLIMGYKVYCTQAFGLPELVKTFDASTNRVVIKDIPKTLTRWHVVAYNVLGDGEPSNAVDIPKRVPGNVRIDVNIVPLENSVAQTNSPPLLLNRFDINPIQVP